MKKTYLFLSDTFLFNYLIIYEFIFKAATITIYTYTNDTHIVVLLTKIGFLEILRELSVIYVGRIMTNYFIIQMIVFDHTTKMCLMVNVK